MNWKEEIKSNLESSKANLKYYKDKLVKSIVEDKTNVVSYDIINYYKALGSFDTFTKAVNFINQFPSIEKVNMKEFILRNSLMSVDDGWSGRGNDLARCRHEGKIEALKDIQDILRYE